MKAHVLLVRPAAPVPMSGTSRDDPFDPRRSVAYSPPVRMLSHDFVDPSVSAKGDQLLQTPPHEKSTSRLGYLLLMLLVAIAPVLLLATASLLVHDQIAATSLGNHSLAQMRLIEALVLPLVLQAACMPLYMGLGDDLYQLGPQVLARRLVMRLPPAWAASLVVVGVCECTWGWLNGWMPAELSILVASAGLHILFSQLLVYCVLTKRWWLWLLAWVGYFLALVSFPRLWFLPPLAGALVLFPLFVRSLKSNYQLVLDANVPLGIGVGLLIGSILWGDKVVGIILGNRFHLEGLVFLCLIPSLVIYGDYFARVAPRVDEFLRILVDSAPKRNLSDFRLLLDEGRELIRKAIRSMVVVGASATGLTMLILTTLFPSAGAALPLGVLSAWTLACETVLIFLLLSVRARRTVSFTCCLNIALLALCVLLAPSYENLLTIVIAGSLVRMLFLAFVVKREWWTIEYRIFWKPQIPWGAK